MLCLLELVFFVQWKITQSIVSSSGSGTRILLLNLQTVLNPKQINHPNSTLHIGGKLPSSVGGLWVQSLSLMLRLFRPTKTLMNIKHCIASKSHIYQLLVL